MDVDKATGLLDAARAGDEARVRALLPPTSAAEEKGPPDAPDGVTPLMAAAAGGHETVVELLLKRGADPALRDAQGPQRRRARPRRRPHASGGAARHRRGQGKYDLVTGAAREGRGGLGQQRLAARQQAKA